MLEFETKQMGHITSFAQLNINQQSIKKEERRRGKTEGKVNSKVGLKHRNNARFQKNEFQVCICDNNIGDGYRYTTVNSNHIIFLSITFELSIMCSKFTIYPSTIAEGKVIVVENFFFPFLNGNRIYTEKGTTTQNHKVKTKEKDWRVNELIHSKTRKQQIKCSCIQTITTVLTAKGLTRTKPSTGNVGWMKCITTQ